MRPQDSEFKKSGQYSKAPSIKRKRLIILKLSLCIQQNNSYILKKFELLKLTKPDWFVSSPTFACVRAMYGAAPARQCGACSSTLQLLSWAAMNQRAEAKAVSKRIHETTVWLELLWVQFQLCRWSKHNWNLERSPIECTDTMEEAQGNLTNGSHAGLGGNNTQSPKQRNISKEVTSAIVIPRYFPLVGCEQWLGAKARRERREVLLPCVVTQLLRNPC